MICEGSLLKHVCLQFKVISRRELFCCSLHLPFLLKHKVKLLLKGALEMFLEQISRAITSDVVAVQWGTDLPGLYISAHAEQAPLKLHLSISAHEVKQQWAFISVWDKSDEKDQLLEVKKAPCGNTKDAMWNVSVRIFLATTSFQHHVFRCLEVRSPSGAPWRGHKSSSWEEQLLRISHPSFDCHKPFLKFFMPYQNTGNL